jgi:hypothetical protein
MDMVFINWLVNVPRYGGQIDTLMDHLGMSMDGFPIVEIERMRT